MLCGVAQDAVRSSYRGCVRVTKLVLRLSKALQILKKTNDETASDSSKIPRDVLDVIHMRTSVFRNAGEHAAVLYIKTVAAHTQSWKQTSTFHGCGCYSYAAMLLQELRIMHVIAREKYSLKLGDFLVTKRS